MNHAVFGNPLRDWAWAVGGGVLAWALVSVLRDFLVRRLEGLAARTPMVADDVLVELIRSVRRRYVALAALSFGLLSLDLPPWVLTSLRWTAAAILVLQGLRSANRLIAFWLDHYSTSRARSARMIRTSGSSTSRATMGTTGP